MCMDRRINNIEVFKNTRELSTSKFLEDTKNMINNTVVYEEPYNLDVKLMDSKQIIEFTTNDTISQVLEVVSKNNHVAILNFADALVPGGLVFDGEFTQEEDICRCSNLYESLITDKCHQGYYVPNLRLRNRQYSDRLIYSNGVRILKHGLNYNLVDKDIFIDVITCPAPSMPVPHEVLCKRIEGIIKPASYNGADTIILGAWGCGAFGQDAFKMGQCFGHVLKKYNIFKEVYFAIKCVVSNTDTGNYENFQLGFYSKYLIETI